MPRRRITSGRPAWRTVSVSPSVTPMTRATKISADEAVGNRSASSAATASARRRVRCPRATNVSDGAEPATRTRKTARMTGRPTRGAPSAGVLKTASLPARCRRRRGGTPLIKEAERGGPLAPVDHVDSYREDLAVHGRPDLRRVPGLVRQPLELAPRLRHGLPGGQHVRVDAGEAAGRQEVERDERARLAQGRLAQ